MEYYVYVARVDSVIVYVGSGKGNRYKHVTSGASHVVSLNSLILQGVCIHVEIVAEGLSKGRSLDVEQDWLDMHTPTYNKNRAKPINNKTITEGMLLMALFKSDHKHTQLTCAEIGFLSKLISCVDFRHNKNYEVNLSIARIAALTGLSYVTAHKSKSVLVKKGWISVTSGAGKTQVNNYAINTRKIIECASLSGFVL